MAGDYLQKQKELQDALAKLEEEAGIVAAMEHAREGRFIPLGIDDPSVTPDEYFADEHDARRDKTRKVYFGVEDIKLRKKLITADLAFDRLRATENERERIEAYKAMKIAEHNSRKEPWLGAAIWAALLVGFGTSFFGLPGAIGGGLIAYFLGRTAVAEAKNEALRAFEQAQENFRDAEKTERESKETPPFFSNEEERTGECDEEFGQRSALFEYYDRQRKAANRDAASASTA